MADFTELMKDLSPEQQMKIGEAIRDSFMERMQADKKEKVEQYRRLNKFVKPGQILFAGSSLMEQFPVNELIQGYEIPYRVYNRGIGGFTTFEMLEVMDACVYDVQPKYLFINIGTNDINLPGYTPEALMERYEGILRGIMEKVPGVTIFMMAYYPVNEVVGANHPYMKEALKIRTNAKIREANEHVKALSEKLGLTYLDCNAGITDETGNQKAEFTKEGMHFFADGYYEVLQALLPVLTNLK